MPTLPSDLRNKLERVVVEARDMAEGGARAALEALAVYHYEPYPHMSPEQRDLRNHLRARARQLGDRQDRTGRLAIDHLVRECAYEHWHRMLFARFLAENGLLIEPEMGVAISLDEAEELAKEEGQDMWAFASRCAQTMLPQIFRPDDPLLQVAFAPEHMLKLEGLLDLLPPQVFAASDALGWVYQFWQSKKKDEVNRSEVKIGADELPAVTQLFTEPYMVSFLIHNTLGAWWAGKQLAEDPQLAETAENEDELRKAVSLPGVDWEYLRFVRGEDGKGGAWRPAAGTFEGWPKQAAQLKVLDPCCGSGHFLVAALHHLVPSRMAEEGLSVQDAVDAVLRDNLHGLEIDERCCQIAAFALAIAAWAYPGASGHRPLPELHIACSGVGPQATAEEWLKLAEQSGIRTPAFGREAIRNGLLNLHRLFSQAPTLGSLINPAELPANLLAADYETIQPYLAAIVAADTPDDELRERAIAAAGMVKAAGLLAGEYTLVITNVPYLAIGRFTDCLREHVVQHWPDAKNDLALAFIDRCLGFACKSGITSAVFPQGWLFQGRERHYRKRLLKEQEWCLLARLGPGAFSMISGEVVQVCLGVFRNRRLAEKTPHQMTLLDASIAHAPQAKEEALSEVAVRTVTQQDVLRQKATVLSFGDRDGGGYLGDYAEALRGLSTGEAFRFIRKFWELPQLGEDWAGLQSDAERTGRYEGRSNIILWENEAGQIYHLAQELKHLNHAIQSWRRGKPNWGKTGVAMNLMGGLYATLYSGDRYSANVGVLIPKAPEDLGALWLCCSSTEFVESVRAFNQKVSVEPRYFEKVAVDFAAWREKAVQNEALAEVAPESDDPTQWLFHGRPEESTAPLQVAVARLLGRRWPAELDDEMRLSKRARALVKRCEALLKFVDDDGIVCVPSVRGEAPAAERLRALLAVAYGEDWSPAKERELLKATGCSARDLDEWLQGDFFEQHCKLFHHRPFVWHIWDGRQRDGFSALVNYHKLAAREGEGRRLLESLTYSYLGDWITRQKDGVRRGEEGAEDRLAAALELQKRLVAILEGEPPFDIFVRWKPLHEQPIGWEPDINDGVRLNIRPFMADDLPKSVCSGARKGAGILRWKPNIKWGKERGKEPERPKDEYPWFWSWDENTEDFAGGAKFDGNRWNDCHYSVELKRRAFALANEDSNRRV